MSKNNAKQKHSHLTHLHGIVDYRDTIRCVVL